MSLSDSLPSTLAALAVGAVLFAIIRYFGLHRFEGSTGKRSVATPTGLHVVSTFALYLAVQMIGGGIGAHFFELDVNGQDGLIQSGLGWIPVITTFISSVMLLIYVCQINSSQLNNVIFKNRNVLAAVQQFFVGIASWIIAFPAAMIVGYLVGVIVSLTVGVQDVEQLAIQYYRSAFGDPVLLWLSTLTIGLVIPFAEELLFRAMLQSWLRRYLSVWPSILFSAAIFACFHYSDEQGVQNFQLIASLFVLAIFLGFLLESQRSIWAPAGLHAAFNGVTLLMLNLE